MSQLAKLFEVDRRGINVRRGVGIAAMMLTLLVVLNLAHLEQYWLSVAFGALFVGFCDPGGDYGYRVPRLAVVGLVGAALTALGFAMGNLGWGWVVLAVFTITLLGGLTVRFGVHRFVAGVLLNLWFLIALSLPRAYDLDQIHTVWWAQALAWLVGSVLVIAYTGAVWLVRGRTAQARPAADVIPGSTSPVQLTGRVILFAVIRALAVSISAAVPFGLHLQDADWMPVATMVAMKPSLQQSLLVAEQRVAGAVIGAAVAALVLLTVGNKVALAIVIVVLAAAAASIRFMNYAWYCAAMAGAVLIAMDLPHPSNFADEGRRILFTFAGVGIGVVVMLLVSRLQERAASRPPTAAAGSG